MNNLKGLYEMETISLSQVRIQFLYISINTYNNRPYYIYTAKKVID